MNSDARIGAVAGKPTLNDRVNNANYKRKRSAKNDGAGKVPGVTPVGGRRNYQQNQNGKYSGYEGYTVSPQYETTRKSPAAMQGGKIPNRAGGRKGYEQVNKPLYTTASIHPNPVPNGMISGNTYTIPKPPTASRQVPPNDVWRTAREGYMKSYNDDPAMKRELLYRTDRRLYNKTYNDTAKLTPEQVRHNNALAEELKSGKIDKETYDKHLERSWAEIHGGKNHAYARAIGGGIVRGIADTLAPMTSGFVSGQMNRRDAERQQRYNGLVSRKNKMMAERSHAYANSVKRAVDDDYVDMNANNAESGKQYRNAQVPRYGYGMDDDMNHRYGGVNDGCSQTGAEWDDDTVEYVFGTRKNPKRSNRMMTKYTNTNGTGDDYVNYAFFGGE